MLPTNKNSLAPATSFDTEKPTTITNTTATTIGSTSVYINPKFRNAHINPNFLPKKPLQSLAPPPNQIYINPKFKNAHINPMFLQKNPPTTTVAVTPNHNVAEKKEIPPNFTPQTSIVTKTSRKIVRQSVVAPNIIQKSPPKLAQQKPVSVSAVPLVKLGKRKLVRLTQQLKTSSISKLPTKPLHTLYKIVKGDMPKNLYKIDRRLVRSSISKNRMPIKSVHRISSGGLNETLAAQKVIITNRKLLRMYEI